MEELLASTGYTIPTLRRGQQVSGKVVAVARDEVLVDIGAKSEGVVAGRELEAASDLVATMAVGDKIDAVVLYPENEAGQVVLSLRKFSLDRRWEELEKRQENDEPVEVAAVEVNRGGVICEYAGIRGFLPASQLVGRLVAPDSLIGKSFSVYVLEVDRQTNRLIFAQKEPSEKDLEVLSSLISKVNIGDRVTGEVSAVLPFGIFVEIQVGLSDDQAVRSSGKEKPDNLRTRQPENPLLEGLVHISEISWEKVEDPVKLFKVGDKIGVMVVAKDEKTGRLGLSIKQQLEDPFAKVSEKYSKDSAVSGKVTRVSPYGVVVMLEDGVEGMIPLSKLPPDASYDLGKTVECSVESVDTKTRRVTLTPLTKEKPILYR